MGVRMKVSDWWCRQRHPQLQASFAITSHLTARERVELCTLAARPGVRSIVEIGAYLGASAAAFGTGLAQSSNRAARVYCVDTWNNDAMSEGQRDTMMVFLDNTARFAPAIVPVRGWSTDVAPSIAKQAGSIDLLFIDGDHSYDGCLADWRAYKGLLAPGACVVFHDIGWAEGVARVVDTEVRALVGEEARLPNLWWGRLA